MERPQGIPQTFTCHIPPPHLPQPRSRRGRSLGVTHQPNIGCALRPAVHPGAGPRREKHGWCWGSYSADHRGD
nr:MAG TPA: hypothetical protein [Caudoviricetes sp.]DAR63993.1 MAG TPA: hypothetical protein [Caudoviricetes sp.]